MMMDVGFLGLWLIQSHLLLLIFSSTGTWFVFCRFDEVGSQDVFEDDEGALAFSIQIFKSMSIPT